jgi:AraC-like DNA-binding protein
MGITELVEPLVYHGTTLGVFFYGGFVLEGTQVAGEERIRRYCTRTKLAPDPFLAEHRALTVISESDMTVLQGRLRLVVQVAERLLAAKGIQAEGYKTLPSAFYSNRRWRFPAMVRAAMGVIETQYSEPLTLGEVAAKLHCHPDYLGRVFRRATGEAFGDYLARYRVERACRLIEAQETLTLGEVAWRVGFQDQSHFGRVFRKLTGSLPGDYRGALGRGEKPAWVYAGAHLSQLVGRDKEAE